MDFRPAPSGQPPAEPHFDTAIPVAQEAIVSDLHVCAVDIGQAQPEGFSDAQARSIDRGENGLMLKIINGVQDAPHLVHGQDNGEALFFFGAGDVPDIPLTPQGSEVLLILKEKWENKRIGYRN